MGLGLELWGFDRDYGVRIGIMGLRLWDYGAGIWMMGLWGWNGGVMGWDGGIMGWHSGYELLIRVHSCDLRLISVTPMGKRNHGVGIIGIGIGMMGSGMGL